MLLLDVNVLLAVHREDHPQHELARGWFDGTLREQRAFTVPDAVWAAFLRLATNRRIFEVPTPRDEAFAFVDAVCAQPRFRASGTGGHHLELVRRMCDEGDASGDLVPDAVIAAIALALEATVVTFDRDFARFPSVAHWPPGP